MRSLGRGLGLAAIALLVACVDLFHATDFPTLCETEPGACDASAASSDATAVADAARAPTDFCTWDGAVASSHAEHACAWLGACAGPFGGNAFGECLLEAKAAYDCSIHPERPVRGRTFALWDCLWRADDCSEVTRCVLPDGAQDCASGPFVACATGGASNSSARVSCLVSGAAAGIEPCAARGQTCVRSSNVSATCGGSAGPACTKSGCDGAQLRVCADGGSDDGVDCESFGAGTCIEADGGPASCLALGTTCPASSAVTCKDGTATGCPSGATERVDCGRWLGVADSCLVDARGAAWDVRRACGVARECEPDRCEGDRLVSCARGVSLETSCSAHGLGSCGMTTLDGVRRARCERR